MYMLYSCSSLSKLHIAVRPTPRPHNTCLPRNLRNRSDGEQANSQLADLVHAQNAQGKRQWDGPELDRDRGSPEQVLDARDLGNEDRNRRTNDHAEKQPRVAPLLGEGVGLEDAQPAVSDRQDVAPLQDDQCYKVYTLPNGVEARPACIHGNPPCSPRTGRRAG